MEIAGRILDIGDAHDVYGSPQDPYTKALLAAIPVADPRRMRDERDRRRAIRQAADLPE